MKALGLCWGTCFLSIPAKHGILDRSWSKLMMCVYNTRYVVHLATFSHESDSQLRMQHENMCLGPVDDDKFRLTKALFFFFWFPINTYRRGWNCHWPSWGTLWYAGRQKWKCRRNGQPGVWHFGHRRADRWNGSTGKHHEYPWITSFTYPKLFSAALELSEFHFGMRAQWFTVSVSCHNDRWSTGGFDGASSEQLHQVCGSS